MLGLLAVPYASPRLAPFRVVRAPWEPAEIADIGPDAVADQAASPKSGPTLTQGETKLQASKNEATVTNALPDRGADTAPDRGGDKGGAALDAKAPSKTQSTQGTQGTQGSLAVEDASGTALDAFYTQLAKTQAKQASAVTRVMHLGDSVITSDYVSGTMRRKMQAEYGDAGHGFLLVANPWEWYFHNDVGHGAGDGWSSSRIVGPLTKDGMYGLGGVTFTGAPGANAWFSTAERSSYGKKVSRFDVYYLETPGGGDVELKVASANVSEKLSTKGEAKVSRVKSIPVPDGEAKLQIKVASGSPRLFGVALERDVPGVVYDAIGMNGGRAELWNGMDGAHWKEQLELRKPSLVVLQFGTNESEAPGIARDYEQTLKAVIDKIKAAAPTASILIAAPLDRAENTEGGMRTKPIIKRLVAAQRSVAKDTGVAFWNTFEAMGGEGSMATWVKKGLAGSDLTHPSPQGAEIIGDLMYKSLKGGFEAWQSKRGK
jgi:lysophospholipase L1-like esterase